MKNFYIHKELPFDVHYGGVIGPYLFGNSVSEVATLSDIRYHQLLTEFLSPKLNNISLEGMRFLTG